MLMSMILLTLLLILMFVGTISITASAVGPTPPSHGRSMAQGWSVGFESALDSSHGWSAGFVVNRTPLPWLERRVRGKNMAGVQGS